jgi:hypothetical protein
VSGMASAPAVSRRALMTLLACVAAMLAFTLTAATAARADFVDDGDVAITDDGPNRLDLWTVGSDSAVYQKTWQAGQGWTDWISRGGTATSAPSVVHFPDGHYAIYVRGTDNGLWIKNFYPNNGWQGWIGAGGSYASTPQVSYTQNGNWVNVVSRTTDGRVSNRVWTSGGGWAAEDIVPDTVIGSPTVVDWNNPGVGDRGDVFALRAGTDVYQNTNINLRWGGWAPLNGLATSSVRGAYGGGKMTLVARGSDSRTAYVDTWTTSSNRWSGWGEGLRGAALSSNPTVHYWPQSDGTPRWVVAGRQAADPASGRPVQVVTNTYTNDGWNGWNAVATIGPGSYTTSARYGGSDGHINTQDEADIAAWAIEDADGPTADYLTAGIDPADRDLVNSTLKLSPFYDVAVTTDGPDRLDLWTLRSDRGIYQKTWQSGVGWSDWLPLNGSSKSPPSVIHFPNGSYTIYARGSNNDLWTRTWTPSGSSGEGNWGAWTDKGLPIESSPQTSYSANTDTVNVVARNARNGVINRVLTSGGDFVMDLPSDAAAAGSPTVIDWVNGSEGPRGDLFTVGPQSAVYQRTNVNLQWTTPDWVSLGGQATSNVHADFGDGQLTLATRDPDGRSADIRTWRAERGWDITWNSLGGAIATSPTVHYWPDADGNPRWIVVGRDGFPGTSPRPGQIVADIYTKNDNRWSGWQALETTPGVTYPGTSVAYGGSDFTINTQSEINAAVADIRSASAMYADTLIGGIRRGSERDTVWQAAFPVSWACGDPARHSATTDAQIACAVNLFDSGTLDADAQNVLDGLSKDNLKRVNAVLRARVRDSELVRDVSDGGVYLYSVFSGGAVQRVLSRSDAARGRYDYDAARRVSHTVLSSWVRGPDWTPPPDATDPDDSLTVGGDVPQAGDQEVNADGPLSADDQAELDQILADEQADDDGASAASLASAPEARSFTYPPNGSNNLPYTCRGTWAPIQADVSGFVMGNCAGGTAVDGFYTYVDTNGYPGARSEGRGWEAVSLPPEAHFDACGWMNIRNRLTGVEGRPPPNRCASGALRGPSFTNEAVYIKRTSGTRVAGSYAPPNSTRYHDLYVWARRFIIRGRPHEAKGYKFVPRRDCTAYANINPYKSGQQVLSSERMWTVHTGSANLRIRYIARYRARKENGDLSWWVMSNSINPSDSSQAWGFISADCLFAP